MLDLLKVIVVILFIAFFPQLIIGVGIYIVLFLVVGGLFRSESKVSTDKSTRTEALKINKIFNDNQDKENQYYNASKTNGLPSSYRKTYYGKSGNDADSYDYYDDWCDEIPLEDGDGFRGTGAPFL